MDCEENNSCDSFGKTEEKRALKTESTEGGLGMRQETRKARLSLSPGKFEI